jgi:dimethylhistidine N-methyltransferase
MRTAPGDFAADLLEGLKANPKSLPSRYLFDERGAGLFDLQSRQPENYIGESENEIYSYFGPEIVKMLGENVLLIEPGSGPSLKVGALLDVLKKPAGYVALDVARDFMIKSVEALAEKYPYLPLVCISADFFQLEPLPGPVAALGESRTVFFPGNTIGHFGHAAARSLLESFRELSGPGGKILVGVDLPKSPDLIRKAYQDQAQVADRFHLNLLARSNREGGADFDLLKFRYEAKYNEDLQRAEMYVVSMASQSVTVGGQKFEIANNERILAGCSYQYAAEQFQELAEEAGCRPVGLWLDSRHYFSVHLLEA